VILVTGAAGSVGSALGEQLSDAWLTDSAWHDYHLDVTDRGEVEHWVRSVKPSTIFHLAGAKHAPQGELDPAHVAAVNITGTLNVLRAAVLVGAKVVMASTCKACDPETAYGASKLIAERAVLNARGVVVRYFNIPESAGNVFRLWESLPLTDPIPWTDCWRFFVSMQESVELTIAASSYPSGRYAPKPGLARHMHDVAMDLYPDRRLVQVPLRRGDRYREPLHARCESVIDLRPDLMQIVSPHDPISASDVEGRQAPAGSSVG
jgi:FlaA1/EpsC-like NDP-sugar epimerase